MFSFDKQEIEGTDALDEFEHNESSINVGKDLDESPTVDDFDESPRTEKHCSCGDCKLAFILL